MEACNNQGLEYSCGKVVYFSVVLAYIASLISLNECIIEIEVPSCCRENALQD